MQSRLPRSLLCFTLLFAPLSLACGSAAPDNPGSGGSGGQSSTGSGGAPGSGGVPGSGGGTGTGGSPASGGSTNTGGSSASGGRAGTGGASASGGAPASGGRAGTGGAAAGSGGAAGGGAKFSFFMTSQAGLGRLANNANGFGGDLRFGKADGLTGADEICKQLAEASMPGNGKTWRAFLSVTKGPGGGAAVNAIDRVGEGPWYDRLGRLVAMNKAGLLSERPQGADAAIINDLPNEDGIPNHNPGSGVIDNHNVLTGSTTSGTLDTQGLMATCQDWTSAVTSGGRPRCGVSWPRSSIVHWISELNEGGCAPGATPGGGAQSGPQGTVGALGGYGGFYCFATTP